jgi:hypothetical protein
MAVISIRLNKNEDIIDDHTITEYEAKREKGEVQFVDSHEIIAALGKSDN